MIQKIKNLINSTLGVFIVGIIIGYLINNVYYFFNLRVNEYLLNYEVESIKDHTFKYVRADQKTPLDFSDVNLRTFWDVWTQLENDFIPPPVQIDTEDESKNKKPETEPKTRKDYLYSAISGLTFATEDPNTNFFNPEFAKDFRAEILDGNIDGIGVYVGIKDNALTILRPIKDGPAYNAGLEENDVILEIDGVLVLGESLNESSSRIRGNRGTKVEIKIYRPSIRDELIFKVERAKINIPTIETKKVDNVFVITNESFNKQTPKLFKKALEEYINDVSTDRLLIDLRGNPGGLLDVGVYIVGLFIGKGKPVLYEYRGVKNSLLRYKSKTNEIFTKKESPVTILVDRGSASASEIITIALKHYKIADVVGTNTFGKATVQSLRKVGKEGSYLKITIAHWLTPAKKIIPKNGIKPDINYKEDIDKYIKEGKDSFYIRAEIFKKAIEHIKQK